MYSNDSNVQCYYIFSLKFESGKSMLNNVYSLKTGLLEVVHNFCLILFE